MKYMNKLTLGIVLAAGLFTACSDKDDVDIPGGLRPSGWNRADCHRCLTGLGGKYL